MRLPGPSVGDVRICWLPPTSAWPPARSNCSGQGECGIERRHIMPSSRIPDRRVIAVAAVIMQICLGAAYGWSVFVGPLVAMTRWTLTEVSLNFTLAIAFLGLGTIIGGLWQDRVGPRPVATVAGVMYGLGYLLAGWFSARHSLGGLYFSYGMLGGIGMGMGYITPVATLTKWFPDRRGLIDRKSTRLNSSHIQKSRMPSSA